MVDDTMRKTGNTFYEPPNTQGLISISASPVRDARGLCPGKTRSPPVSRGKATAMQAARTAAERVVVADPACVALCVCASVNFVMRASDRK